MENKSENIQVDPTSPFQNSPNEPVYEGDYPDFYFQGPLAELPGFFSKIREQDSQFKPNPFWKISKIILLSLIPIAILLFLVLFFQKGFFPGFGGFVLLVLLGGGSALSKWKQEREDNKKFEISRLELVKIICETLNDLTNPDEIFQVKVLGGGTCEPAFSLSKNMAIPPGLEGLPFYAFEEGLTQKGVHLFQQNWGGFSGKILGVWELSVEIFERVQRNSLAKGGTKYLAQDGLALFLNPPGSLTGELKDLKILFEELNGLRVNQGRFSVVKVDFEGENVGIFLMGEPGESSLNPRVIENKSHSGLGETFFEILDRAVKVVQSKV